jgi:hypothetical protein
LARQFYSAGVVIPLPVEIQNFDNERVPALSSLAKFRPIVEAVVAAQLGPKGCSTAGVVIPIPVENGLGGTSLVSYL